MPSVPSAVQAATWGVQMTFAIAEQGVIGARRFLVKDVQRCTGNFSGLEGLPQGWVIDKRSAARVDEIGRGLHGGKCILIEHAKVFGSWRGM
jgi:hypothetical protein